MRPCLPAMAPSPLLAPCVWRLPSGVAHLPAVRIAGAVSLLGLGFLSLAWVLAITQDVHRGGRSPWVLLVCALVVWVAWRQCRAAWMRWHAVMPELTLIWAGPVQAEPPAGGWRLDHPDGVPAEVRCLLDLQGWLLCQVRPFGGPASSWCWFWLRAGHCPDLHRFRTLMTLPTRATTAVGGDAGRPRSAMASWTSNRQPSGIALRGSSQSFMTTQPSDGDAVTASKVVKDLT